MLIYIGTQIITNLRGVKKLLYEKSELLAGACIIPPVIIFILNAMNYVLHILNSAAEYWLNK